MKFYEILYNDKLLGLIEIWVFSIIEISVKEWSSDRKQEKMKNISENEKIVASIALFPANEALPLEVGNIDAFNC